MLKISNEIKTGIMVITCFLVLAWLIVETGDVSFVQKKGYNIKVRFNFASGIEENAPVRLAGVEVGKVKVIELAYEPQTAAVLTVWLDSKTKIRQDSQAFINTLGLMGEKYIEITSGEADEYLSDGDMLKGEDPFQMERLLKKGEEIAQKLDDTLVDVKALAQNVNGMVSENRQGIAGIVTNLEETSENFNEFSDDIKRHPWKLLMKGKEDKADKKKGEKRR
ncbi:MlaD family protein [Candidatus Omnitrophota bacterium]